MNDQLPRIITATAYVLFLIVSFLLPFYSFEGYSILSNTTSHLGAQGSPNAWLMNTVFIILGLVAILKTYPTGVPFTRVLTTPYLLLQQGLALLYLLSGMRS